MNVCKNCRLYAPGTGTCGVRILHEGEVWRDVPVDPEARCLWEELGVAGQIEQARFWVEDADGRPTRGAGTVKIEYAPGFFGPDGLTSSAAGTRPGGG